MFLFVWIIQFIKIRNKWQVNWLLVIQLAVVRIQIDIFILTLKKLMWSKYIQTYIWKVPIAKKYKCEFSWCLSLEILRTMYDPHIFHIIWKNHIITWIWNNYGKKFEHRSELFLKFLLSRDWNKMCIGAWRRLGAQIFIKL